MFQVSPKSLEYLKLPIKSISKFSIISYTLAPAQITATGVCPNSIRSADMSKVSSAPLCTPPIPPVTNTLIPTK